MEELERRAFVECRVEQDGKRLRGYAIVFNVLSQDLGGFREQIAPEAVDRTLKDAADIRALVDHDTGRVIGRTRAGTLELRKDSKGLRVLIEPDGEISYAKDIMRAVARGDITGMSFAFRALDDEWNYEGKEPIRTVRDMRMSEVSVVSFPAYTQTDVGVAQRSLAAFQEARRSSRVEWKRKVLRTALAR